MSKNIRSILFPSLIVVILSVFAVHTIQQSWEKTLVDFPSYYYGAKLTFVRDTSPYNRNHWNQAINMFGQDQDLYPYVYLPPSLLFFYPLLYFDYQTIQSIFIVVSVLVFLSFFALFFYGILGESKDSLLPLFGALYLLVSIPVRKVFETGQIDFIILLLICIVWWAIKKNKHSVFSIFPLVAAIILKLYPIIILFFLFIQKKFKVIFWVLTLLVIISLVSYAVLPDQIWGEWYDWVGSKGYGQIVSTRLSPSGFGNQNINAFFSRLFLGRGEVMESLVGTVFGMPEEIRETLNRWIIYGVVGVVGLATISLIGLYTLKNKSNASVDLVFSFILTLMLLVAPLTNINHLVYVLPVLFTLIKYLLSEFKSRWRIVLVLVATGMLAYPFNLSDPKLLEGWNVLLLSFYFYAIVMLWVVLASLFGADLKEKTSNVVGLN